MLDPVSVQANMDSMLSERGIEPVTLDLPPGSLVIHNSMCYHAVEPLPASEPGQQHRLFADYIYKSFRYPKARTQPVPLSWLEKVKGDKDRWATRKMLFDRPMGSMFGTVYPEPAQDECVMCHHVPLLAAVDARL
eukprot:SAG22_NODE_574_length_8996_cov_12.163875_2_plen_135_part_00